MKKLIFILILTFPLLSVKAQTLNEELIITDSTYSAEFPGNLKNFIDSNLQYPKEARLKEISGTVYVQYSIDTLGSVSKIKILVGLCSSLDQEAIRVISSMPKWKPGKYKGALRAQTFNIRIKFPPETY
jgi:TonB family protein